MFFVGIAKIYDWIFVKQHPQTAYRKYAVLIGTIFENCDNKKVFVQGQMLEELYSNAYIYTLPSDLEGMPLSLLEAMSYGNCCLVSDIPECAEVVEDKALIFQKSNVEDLQKKLQEACDHPEMVIRMKNQAADFICEKYNWDKVVKETMKLYRR